MRKLIFLGQLCHPIFVYSSSSWRYAYKTSCSENLMKTPNIWKSINQLVDCWIRKKPVEPQINIFNQKRISLYLFCTQGKREGGMT